MNLNIKKSQMINISIRGKFENFVFQCAIITYFCTYSESEKDEVMKVFREYLKLCWFILNILDVSSYRFDLATLITIYLYYWVGHYFWSYSKKQMQLCTSNSMKFTLLNCIRWSAGRREDLQIISCYFI